MSAKILDGKAIAESIRNDVRDGVTAFRAAHGRAPGLDVVLVGEDPASQVYTRNKEKASNEVGMRGRRHVLPVDASEAALLDLLASLNRDPDVDGVLVQLPLPKQIDERRVIDALDPSKDVDGFHEVNVGRLAQGRSALAPCTPVGVMRLLAETKVDLAGLRAVVVGRSNIVGKPVAQLLLGASCTVTIAHSKTRDLPSVCREADVLVAAVGKPEMIRGEWIKSGAIVIDVGINRREAAPSGAEGDHAQTAKTKLVGDVAFDEAKERASWITPVPGGVGPMTIACLLANTLAAAKARVA